jgi:hypothetical protein
MRGVLEPVLASWAAAEGEGGLLLPGKMEERKELAMAESGVTSPALLVTTLVMRVGSQAAAEEPSIELNLSTGD